MVERTSRARHKELRAERLLEAALRVIAREGAAASIDQVATEVGVTRPIIYRYFGSADGLARAVAADTATRVGAELWQLLATVPPGRDLVRAVVDTYLAFIESEPGLYRYLTQGHVSGFVEVLAGEITTMIGRGLEAVGRDPAPAAAWAHGLIGMVGAAGDWWMTQGPMPREDLAEHLTQLAWQGMAGAP